MHERDGASEETLAVVRGRSAKQDLAVFLPSHWSHTSDLMGFDNRNAKYWVDEALSRYYSTYCPTQFYVFFAPWALLGRMFCTNHMWVSFCECYRSFVDYLQIRYYCVDLYTRVEMTTTRLCLVLGIVILTVRTAYFVSRVYVLTQRGSRQG